MRVRRFAAFMSMPVVHYARTNAIMIDLARGAVYSLHMHSGARIEIVARRRRRPSTGEWRLRAR
jgi:hypothetical protein